MPRRSPPSAARLRTGTAAVCAAAAAAALLPDRFGLGDRFPFVDAIAFRPQAAAAAACASVFLAGARWARPIPAALGGVVAAGLAAAVAARAGQRQRPPARTAEEPSELTILAFNVLQGRADCGALSTLIERATPDFVVLPEAGVDYRDKLMPPLEVLGYRSWVSAGPDTPDGRAVTLLAGPRAGELRVRAVTEMNLAHLEATGGRLGARTLYAVHTMAPTSRWRAARWRRDLAVLGRWCAGPTAPIVVGDLNATLDHAALRTELGGACRSAAGAGRRGLVGTYPTRLPRWLGIQIDHILIPAEAVTSGFEIVELAGSDHRAVLATLRLHTGAVACNGRTGGL